MANRAAHHPKLLKIQDFFQAVSGTPRDAKSQRIELARQITGKLSQ
jgi:hypothetical protein